MKSEINKSEIQNFMKCMVLEDEHLALKQMQTYIQRTSFLSLVASVSNAFDAYEAYHTHQPDLLFVDINMPDLSGMEFVKSLKSPCMIIFTTAYSEYALDGYKVNAVDYLLKPIAYPDFLKAVEKAHQLYTLKQNANEEQVPDNSQYLFVKSEYRLVRIKYSEIKYIESMREYVRIYLDNGTSVMTLLSTKSLEERLPKNLFMRVHRSFIVNLDKVSIVERQRIIFDKVVIPVGDQYKEAFSNYVNNNFIGT